jgi:hypothetical protein
MYGEDIRILTIFEPAGQIMIRNLTTDCRESGLDEAHIGVCKSLDLSKDRISTRHKNKNKNKIA